MGNWAGIEKVLPTKNLRLRPCFYLCGDGDSFGGRDGDGKTIPGPAPPLCHPLIGYQLNCTPIFHINKRINGSL